MCFHSFPWASVGQVKFLCLLLLVNRHHLDDLVVVILVSSQGDCVRPKKVYTVLESAVPEWGMDIHEEST